MFNNNDTIKISAKGIIDGKLRDKILIEVASVYPFSVSDIREVYDRTDSFDETIAACLNAIEWSLSSPVYVIDFSLRYVLNGC